MNNYSLGLIVTSTMTLYREALKDAWFGFKKNWQVPLVHLALVIPLSILFQQFAFAFRGFAGSMLAGLIVGTLMAFYLGTVKAGARKEKLLLNELWDQTVPLINPVFSVLFSIFVFSFLLQMLLGGGAAMLLVIFNLVIAVVFNPLPEEILTRGGSFMEIFGEVLGFMKENFIEWLIPWFLCVLLVTAPFFGFAATIQTFLIVEPFTLIRGVFFLFSPEGLLSLSLPQLFFIFTTVFGLYFVFIFRAVLYYKLATSTRRKRAYQHRVGGALS